MADHDTDHVTIREFDGFKQAIVNALGSGFQGVHDRLDKVNGRLDKHDTAIGQLTPRVAEHTVKISTLNNEVFRADRLGREIEDEEAKRTATPDSEPITIKDLKRALWVAGGVLTFIGGLVKYGPVFLKAIAP